MRAACLVVVLAGCELVFSPGGSAIDAPTAPDLDAGIDASPTPGDGAFSVPIKLGLGETGTDYATDPTLTTDVQHLMYAVVQDDSLFSIWSATRNGATSWIDGSIEFGTGDPRSPELTTDGLVIGFSVDLTGGDFDIRSRRRDAIGQPWIVIDDYDTLNGPNDDRVGTPNQDRLHVVMSRRNHPNPGTLLAFDRVAIGAPWSANTIALEQIAGALPGWHVHSPMLSPDGLRLVFAAAETTAMQSDLYEASRDAIGDPFGAPVPIANVNDPELYEKQPWLSADGAELYFARHHVTASYRRDEWGIYYAYRAP